MISNAGISFGSQLERFVIERCRSGGLQLEEALSLFDHLCSSGNPRPSIKPFNSLLVAIPKTKHPHRYSTVISLFSRLKPIRHRGVYPNILTFNVVVACCQRIGKVHLGFCVLGQALKERCGFSPHMFGSLTRGLCAAKKIKDAANVFAKMPLLVVLLIWLSTTFLLKVCAALITLGWSLGCVVRWKKRRVAVSLMSLLTTLLSMDFVRRVRWIWL